jgi:hypothetical protein
MGVLAQAKDGDKQVLEIEISCSQWVGSACTQSALIIFLLSFFFWGRGGDCFHFPFIHNMFP